MITDKIIKYNCGIIYQAFYSRLNICSYRLVTFTGTFKVIELIVEYEYSKMTVVNNVHIFLVGLSDAEMSCLEMVTLLCMGDKTHSQLMELMPERCGTTQNRDFESVLADVCLSKSLVLILSFYFHTLI